MNYIGAKDLHLVKKNEALLASFLKPRLINYTLSMVSKKKEISISISNFPTTLELIFQELNESFNFITIKLLIICDNLQLKLNRTTKYYHHQS